MFVILQLCYENPTRQPHSYRNNLRQITGKLVSTITIWCLVEFGFPYKSSLVKPNLIPTLDRFKPVNQVKSFTYIKALFCLHQFKVIFTDGHDLKGEEVFGQKVPRELLTGVTPAVLTDSRFCNTLDITAFCYINTWKNNSPDGTLFIVEVALKRDFG